MSFTNGGSEIPKGVKGCHCSSTPSFLTVDGESFALDEHSMFTTVSYYSKRDIKENYQICSIITLFSANNIIFSLPKNPRRP
jgi:hypothetical protein